MSTVSLSKTPLKTPLKTSILFLTRRLLLPTSSFSSHCRRHPSTFPVPSQFPPVAKKVPFTVTAHGKTWEDPYHWMREINDPDFIDYFNRENDYAEAFMSDTRNLQRKLFDEMRSRLPTNISTPPERWGPWLYYQYIPEGKEYPVLCRRLDTEKNGWVKTLFSYANGSVRDEVLLDWNELAEQYGYVHVGTCRVSPDHNFLAYTLDKTGSERFQLQVKDLRYGSIVPRSPVDGVVSLAWAQNDRTLFYTTSDKNQRPYRVFCTTLGSDKVDDVLVFTENDPSYCVDITSTKDGKFITVNSNSRTSSEVYVIDTTRPLNGVQRVHQRVPNIQFFLEHHYGMFYVLTNAPLSGKDGLPAENFYLASVPVGHIQRSEWKNIILPSEGMSFHDMDIFEGHLVLFLNKNGVSMLCSIDLPFDCESERHLEITEVKPWCFPMPSDYCSVNPGSNHDFKSSVYRAVLSSPVMLDVIVDYDMSKKMVSIVQQEEVGGVSGNSRLCSLPCQVDGNEHLSFESDKDNNGNDTNVFRWEDHSDAYSCVRKEVISHDGVKVPLTILYSQKAWQSGEAPGLLQGYGAYGEVLDQSWSAERLSLLDRGWLLAFADVRGGGGADSSWHKCGSGLNKLNSIQDFVSCGNYLVNEGYVHRNQLCAIGFSAGGLLVGATINMTPTLFSAAILKVPFLDVCNTLLDPSLPLTLLDYDEFGNPQIHSQFEYIRNYSPYDNIANDCCLPAVLVTSSYSDSRVGVWEAAKWVARVRSHACSTCSRSVILKTNMCGGHFGEGGRYSQCEETAYDYAFLIKIVGNLRHIK